MDADVISKLAKLPWDFQTVIGSGYLAYLLAYVGIRHNHKPVDAVFLTVAFGLVAMISLWLTPMLVFPARVAIALAASLLAGVIWRKLGRTALRALLRTTRYSWADETISAMDHLQENDRHHPRQICVETIDGYTYFCTNTDSVGDLPFGPYVLGNTGDVLMYANESQAPGAEQLPVDGMIDTEWGANITYIPANQVRRIAIRFAPPPPSRTTSSAEVAGWTARARGVVARMLHRLARALA